MKLKEIAIGYIEIPLVTPFKTALRTVNSVNDLIVKVTAEDGTEGYGEAPPTAVITGDTKESIEAAIRYYIAPSIKDMDLDDLPAIMAKMEKCLAKNTTAKAAVDIALYDLYAKLQKNNIVIRWAVYYLILIILLVFGMYGTAYDVNNFIYFRFYLTKEIHFHPINLNSLSIKLY